MARVVVPRVSGGPGMKSYQVNELCGMHKNFAHNPAEWDFSAGAAATVMFIAPSNCHIQRAFMLFTVADTVATTVEVGVIRAGLTDANYFVAGATLGTAAATDMEEQTILNDGEVLEGDIVTATCTLSLSAGQGYMVVEYTIDDEHPSAT